MCLVFKGIERERETPPPVTEKRNTIMILTKKKYEWSAIKIIELVTHFIWLQIFEFALSFNNQSWAIRNFKTTYKMLCVYAHIEL